MLTSTKKSGFSLLELMIVFALIGMLGAFVVPNLFKKRNGAEQKQFLSSFETMLKDAILRSILQGQVHQIYFNIDNELVQLRIHDAKSTETNIHKQFIEVQDPEYKTHFPFLKKFRIKNFFIDRLDQVVVGSALQDVLFYIMPDATSQAIIANFVDESDDAIQDVNFSVVVSPFYARMSVDEKMQTP